MHAWAVGNDEHRAVVGTDPAVLEAGDVFARDRAQRRDGARVGSGIGAFGAIDQRRDRARGEASMR